MARIGDSTARLALPLDVGTVSLVTGPTRSFLRLYHLPRPASDFITERLARAVSRLAVRLGTRPTRIRLTLRSRAGKVRIALRVFRAGSAPVPLAPLVKGAPPEVQAEYRPGRSGGTLSFTSAIKRED